MLKRALLATRQIAGQSSVFRRLSPSGATVPTAARFLGPVKQSRPHAPNLRTVTPYTYRGDRRNIEMLEAQKGFFAGNKNFVLGYHIRKTLQTDLFSSPIDGVFKASGYVSTSLCEQAAEKFAILSKSPLQTVYAMARPMIHTAPYHDISRELGIETELSTEEAEIAAPQSIGFSEIVAYKVPLTASSICFGSWILNPHFIPRNFSIAIRSADETEAQKLGKDRGYFYPLYSTAKIIADILNQAGKEYSGTATFMTCFEELRAEEVEKTLERSAGSGFSESDLPRYYEVNFHEVQKQMGRKRINTLFGGPGTLFAVTPSPQASEPSQSEAATREEVLAYIRDRN